MRIKAQLKPATVVSADRRTPPTLWACIGCAAHRQLVDRQRLGHVEHGDLRPWLPGCPPSASQTMWPASAVRSSTGGAARTPRAAPPGADSTASRTAGARRSVRGRRLALVRSRPYPLSRITAVSVFGYCHRQCPGREVVVVRPTGQAARRAQATLVKDANAEAVGTRLKVAAQVAVDGQNPVG